MINFKLDILPDTPSQKEQPKWNRKCWASLFVIGKLDFLALKYFKKKKKSRKDRLYYTTCQTCHSRTFWNITVQVTVTVFKLVECWSINLVHKKVLVGSNPVTVTWIVLKLFQRRGFFKFRQIFTLNRVCDVIWTHRHKYSGGLGRYMLKFWFFLMPLPNVL